MKKSVIRKYLILSILTGVIMGIIFPIFTSFFMHPKSETSQFIFIASCVMAGIFVGGISFFYWENHNYKKFTAIKYVF